jgi:hypothetical protein
VAHEAHVAEVLVLEEIDQRLRRLGQADGRAVVAGAVADQRGTVDGVSELADVPCHRLQQLARVPGAMDQDVGISHCMSP